MAAHHLVQFQHALPVVELDVTLDRWARRFRTQEILHEDVCDAPDPQGTP